MNQKSRMNMPVDVDDIQGKKKWDSYVETARTNWIFVAAGISALIILLGWVVYGVSPLQEIAEIGYRQEQQRLKEEMVTRHISLGNDFLNVGQLEAAKAEFSKAQTLDSFNAEAQLGLLKASVFEPIVIRGYDPEIVERRLRLILEAKPNDSHVLGYLGDVLRGIDDDSALSCYDQAIRQDANNALAFCGKGVLLDEAGKGEEALLMYQQANLISPWNQTFLNNLGYQYFLLGQYEKAESIYVRLLRLDSRYLLSYYILVQAQLILGSEIVAKNNLQLFWQLASDTSIVNLPRNKGTWFVHVGDRRPVYLYSYEEKMAYAHFISALVEKLTFDEIKFRRHLNEIERLKGLNKNTILTIVWNDIQRIESKNPKWQRELNEFKRELRGVSAGEVE